jgi:hypothetical protein
MVLAVLPGHRKSRQVEGAPPGGYRNGMLIMVRVRSGQPKKGDISQ